MGGFLSYRGVINHQHRIAAADELIGLDQQLSFQGSGIPDPCGDEVVQLIVVTRCKPLRQSDLPPPMVGPSTSRQPMSHRKTDLASLRRSKSAKVVLVAVVVFHELFARRLPAFVGKEG